MSDSATGTLAWGERFLVEAENLSITTEGRILKRENPDATFGEEYQFSEVVEPTNRQLAKLLIALAKQVVQGRGEQP